MFDLVDNKPDFPQLERNVLNWWDENSIVSEYLTKNNNSKTSFSFIDGPITANNPMGVHHAWGRTYKDLFQRYYTMQGHEQRYQNGFDCQGLWVEVEVEKELGFKSKKDIEEFGVEKFVNLCKERVKKYSGVQTEQSIRLGYWMDWDNSYFTMSDENNYAIWDFLKKLSLKGKIYRGTDVVPWSGRSGTSYSQMEIIEGRKLVAHKSVFVKFPLKDRESEYILVWTTTPWTLTSNVCLAINKDLDYVKCKLSNGEVYYLAAENLNAPRLEKEFKSDRDWIKGVPKLKPISQIFNERGGYTIEQTLKGSDLIGLEYNGPFDELESASIEGGHPFINTDLQTKQINAIKCHRIIDGGKDSLGNEFVVAGEGSGIVHVAPGCGDADYKLGMRENLVSIAPLDEETNFTKEFDWLAGKNATATETVDLIIDNLKAKGLLLHSELYPHVYPHCWRSGDELVFRLVDEWYINMDWRSEIKEIVEETNWVPSWGKEREHQWLDNMGDWMISKKRFWGLALPIWCFDDGSFYVVGSKEELKELSVEGWEEFEGNSPHRPWIDKVKIRHPETGLVGTRILDVGNPWLDAGIVAFSTLNYRTNREHWEKWYPADLISESFPGQFRNWFYSYLTMGTALENKTPTKNIFSYAMVRDESGDEMHKSAGNAIWFDDAAEELGVDVIRWLYSRQNPEFNLRFGPKLADEVRRQTIIPLWNIYSFFTNYAILDDFTPPENLTQPESVNLMDMWILSEIKTVCMEVAKKLEDYQPDKATIAVEDFINLLSNWYVRRNRKRFWKPGKFGTNAPFDADKHSAYQTLYFVLVTLAKAIAPIAPFITETIYQNLTKHTKWGKSSVHLEKYPSFKINTEKDLELQKAIRTAMKISSLGRGARSQASIKVRQPLNEIKVIVPEKIDVDLMNEIELEVKEELNIKNVIFLQNHEELAVYMDFTIEPDLAILGPQFGKNINEIKSLIEKTDPIALYSSIQGESEVIIGKFSVPTTALKTSTTDKAGYSSKSDLGYAVVLNTNISNELYLEGIAREFVHNIQNLRREAALEISDKINVMYTESDLLKTVIETHDCYIKSETLCETIEETSSLPKIASSEIKIEGEKLLIGLEKSSDAFH